VPERLYCGPGSTFPLYIKKGVLTLTGVTPRLHYKMYAFKYTISSQLQAATCCADRRRCAIVHHFYSNAMVCSDILIDTSLP
jgi:hypothetical protein